MDLFKLVGTIAIDNAKANAALEDTSSKAKKTGQTLENTGSSGEKTSSKWSSAFSKMGKAASAIGKGVAIGVGAASTAIGFIGKAAISAYADYEQLVGGVDTLFGKSSAKVQEYAANAYKTAGLSANAYMETVTSFSASLLQSLGGDTAKAAKYADTAITDMSDNANKMGTDMSMIQNAYQGFAKQNFTMLDNLKLGYGGTKEEMQRLLEDAQKLDSSITPDVSDFGNVVKAIHAVQTEMGITGTTAKEASSTISGSLGMVKASWTNVLTGMTDPTQNFDVLIQNLGSSIETFAGNLIPRLQQVLSGIAQMISQLAPTIVPMIAQLVTTLIPHLVQGATALIQALVQAMPAVVQGLMAALPALIQGLVQIFNQIVTALPQLMQVIISALPALIPQLINGLVSMIVTLCNSLPKIIQPIITYLPKIIVAIVNALMQNLPALIQGAVNLVVGIVQALPQIILGLVQAMPTVIKSIVQGLIAAAPVLINGWKTIWNSVKEALSTIMKGISQVVSNVWNAIKNAVQPILNAIKTAITNAWNAIKTGVSNAVNAVKTVITNIWNGIKSVTSTVWNAIKTAVTTPINAAKTLVSNVVNGIKTTVSNVFNGIKTTATNVWNGIKDAITKPIEKARDTIRGIIDKIKGIFGGLKLEFPKIKMPHFGISPSGWKIGDLLKGSIPKLSIDWYAKAMRTPMIMDDPTIFGYDAATGKYMGGGETGSEMIGGTNTIMNMIRAAVSEQNNGIVYYLQRLIELLADYFPQVLSSMDRDFVFSDGTMAAKLAPAMDVELGKIKSRKDRGR